MMYPTETIKARLEAISWFAHCGEPPPESLARYPVQYVDRAGMTRSYDSLGGMCAAVDAGGGMPFYPAGSRPDRPRHERDRVAGLAAAYFDDLFLDMFEGYTSTFGLGGQFVVWNRSVILLILIADHYRDLGADAAFPDMVLASYEAGRYPCGWAGGEWPEGRLLVW